MKILLLSGGLSNEREVSLRSAVSVRAGLIQNGHIVIDMDPAVGLDALQQYVGKVDLVFPVLHGKYGEDGEVQQVLEELGLPFVGAQAAVSRMCLNKENFNRFVFECGYVVPRSQLVTRQQFNQSEIAKQSFVLKPNDGGSSIDLLMAVDPIKARDQVDALFKNYDQLQLQELIVGTEITVAVLGNEALPVVEIIPPEGEEFDYENKYNGKTQELCPPISINPEIQSLAQHIALDIHRQLGVRHLSRTDMIVDKSGTIYVLELNTIPGMTENSLFPKAAKAAGMDNAQLIQRLVDLATT